MTIDKYRLAERRRRKAVRICVLRLHCCSIAQAVHRRAQRNFPRDPRLKSKQLMTCVNSLPRVLAG